MNEPESVLSEAERIINGSRRQDYGDTYDSFDLIGRLWGDVLGVEVTAEQVALCMIQLKVARWINGQQRDSVVDIAGYAGCIDKMQQRRAREGGLR
jgi:hypothetical protein